MSTRKRVNSANPRTEGTHSKRAKLLSGLWVSQGQAVGSLEGSESLSGQSSGSVYHIKAIIGENPSEYLIDWADDPITGKSFEPSWVRSPEFTMSWNVNYLTSSCAMNF